MNFKPLIRSLAPAFLLGWSAASLAEDFAFHHENVLGTFLEIRMTASNAGQAEKIEQAILASIDRSRNVLSEYEPGSEFRRWQEPPGQAAPVSEELFAALEAGLRYQELTRGAFHPGVGVLSKLWSEAEQADRLPDASTLTAAAERMSTPLWKLDPATFMATKLAAGPFTLQAFTKGTIIDRAGDAVMTAEGLSLAQSPAPPGHPAGIRLSGMGWTTRAMPCRRATTSSTSRRHGRRAHTSSFVSPYGSAPENCSWI